ncbi:MAG: copper transporter [Clostridia bacterium]
MSRGITYHIMTIAAIFIALGLGIFIGSMLNGEQLVMNQQSKIMSEMDEHNRMMSQENRQLRGEIVALSSEILQKSKLIESIFEQYMKDRLKDYNVAIITSSGKDLCSEVKLLLQFAGANILSITSINNISNEEVINVFNENQFESIPIIKKEVNMATYAAEHLMYSILSGNNAELINHFAYMEFIDTEGDYSQMADYVIWIGPNEYGSEVMQLIDIPMLSIVKKMNIPSLVVEKSDSEYSSIDVFKNLGFSTVDNIDTIYGKIALSMVMKGVQGNFGIKDSSTSLLPDYGFEIIKESE